MDNNENFKNTDEEYRNNGGYAAVKTGKATVEAYDWLKCIVAALLICVLAFAFIFRVIGVVGYSMEPTLQDKDKIITTNLFYTPQQGDIVVLRKESFDSKPIVKRVIATAGQTIDIDFSAGVVYVDGLALTEDYTAAPTNKELDFKGEITVPDGCVFVMGDNRNKSTDSRDERIGCVDTRYIIGKVLFRVLPIDNIGSPY